jgi:excisionase family DNA binding protein
MGANRDQLGLQEVADLLEVHYMTAYRYVRTGRLEATKDHGQWMVERAALARFSDEPQTAPQAVPASARRRPRSQRLEARMLAGDRPGAVAVAEEALAAGASWSEVQVDLLAPALRSIGDRWEAGTLSVGDEHRATVVAQHVLAVVGSRFARRGRRRDAVVIGAAPGDAHQIPVAIVADHLRAAGFEVVDYGADTPPEAFASAAADLRPLAVVVGVTTPGSAPDVGRVARAVREAAPGVAVLAGGAAIHGDADARRLGADRWTGPDARAVVAAVSEVLPVGRARAEAVG